MQSPSVPTSGSECPSSCPDPHPTHGQTLPSTLVRDAEIAHPKSSASSVSTTTSVVPKPIQTATSSAANPTFQTLNDDILCRLFSHVLADSRRGTPHYPSKDSPEALAFAQASPYFCNAVATQMTSDYSWINITGSDTTSTGLLQPAFARKVLAWYRITAPHLTALHLHSKLTYFPALRNRVMEKLLDARPSLKFINLASFDKLAEPPMHEDLSELLNISRSSISKINVDLTPKLLETICAARLTSVTELEVKIRPQDTAHNLIKLLKSLSSEETPLTHMTMRVVANSLPDISNPQKIYAAAPHIRTIEYREGGMESSAEVLREGFLRVAQCYRDIQTITLNTCVLELASLHSLLDREKYPSFHQLKLVKCVVYDLPSVLAAASDRITHLELTLEVDRASLQAIGRCKGIRELGITMGRDAADGLKHCIASLEELRALTLTFNHEGPRVERHVIEALENARQKFEKFVLHGEALQYEGIRHIMQVLGPQLQYWVTGVYTPTKSRSRVMMRLLKDTASFNPNMKVLCFGLYLTYDRRGLELQEELGSSIETAGQKLRGLDTYWLKRNAKSILEISRPSDFVDYESDESDVEVY